MGLIETARPALAPPAADYFTGVNAELADKGIHIGRKRIARLMRKAGLAGVSRRKFVVTTLKGDGRQAPDLVERNFTAAAPDRLWVADISVPQQAA